MRGSVVIAVCHIALALMNAVWPTNGIYFNVATCTIAQLTWGPDHNAKLVHLWSFCFCNFHQLSIAATLVAVLERSLIPMPNFSGNHGCYDWDFSRCLPFARERNLEVLELLGSARLSL